MRILLKRILSSVTTQVADADGNRTVISAVIDFRDTRKAKAREKE